MSISSPEHVPSEPSAGSAAPAGPAHELLACVSCRSRKLKCDRQKPLCTRCARTGGECLYPESRRKPAFKRRNVRELEERLAQVEDLLKAVGKQRASRPAPSGGVRSEGSSPSTLSGGPAQSVRHGSSHTGATPAIPRSPIYSPSSPENDQPGELVGLGRFESLPPFEMIEDLHATFFATQQHFLPIVHPGNYLRSFHSPPHMRPPMCLQYAIWTNAASGHPKYRSYHDALYRRARQYLEADELKGHGEHFITIGHAQAWALVATDEARRLLFTRAAMSSAKSVRLAGMMGLSRLDSTIPEEDSPTVPMIDPPRNWIGIEERRRLFWGGFCIDSYASISTGWPTLIDVDLVTTHLPVSEEAFASSTEEKACTLQDALNGSSSYSTLAGNVIIAYIFARLVRHSQRPMPNDRPEDPEFGPFWKRHRELDNMLSNAFMFLPERFRLSRNTGDPSAVQTNLNLLGAVICLHSAAREKADRYRLAGIRQASRTRALTAAQQIVNIAKATVDISAACRTPLMVLSLYFAASAYTAQAKDDPQDFNRGNLELLIRCMAAIGHQHVITHAYLGQILRDIERIGVTISPDIIRSFNCPGKHDNYRIPLVARGPTSRHSKVEPPLPGRLPLGAPQGTVLPKCNQPSELCASFVSLHPSHDDVDVHVSKRVRTSARPGAVAHASAPDSPAWFVEGNAQTSVDPAPDLFEYTGTGWAYATKYTNPPVTVLPHRTGSPAINTRTVSPAPANMLPDFTGFSMPSSAAAASFPQMQSTTTGFGSGTAFGLDTTTATSTTTNSADSNPAMDDNTLNPEDLPDMEMFESLRDWGISDPQSIYGMLLDLSGGAGIGTAQSQSQSQSHSQDSRGMDPWS